MNFKKIWHFIWYEDSLASIIVNIILAIIIVKFIIYPSLGFILSTTHPVVAVVSSSMEHNNNFDSWWGNNKEFYLSYNISKSQFTNFPFHNGFNKGDIMVLVGVEPKNIKIGDVVVYKSFTPNPIIHRVVKKNIDTFQTKGDNVNRVQSFEQNIDNNQIIGKAIFKIPLLGWVKIKFIELISWFK